MYKFLPHIQNTPVYVIDEGLLRKNLEVLKGVQDNTGCKIVLALKGFAMFSLFGVIKQYLHGTAASSLNEARLGFEEFGPEVHICAPAYREDEIGGIIKYVSHINFNSFSQWTKYKEVIENSGKDIECGIRVNPEHSEVKVHLYDPCAPGSRLGVKAKDLESRDLNGISGIHFHTLCELGPDALERTLKVVEAKFGKAIKQMKWVNFGGGHHITREDYDTGMLCRLIDDFRKKYDVEVYLEPGEAIALNTGFLVSSVLDIMPGEDLNIAVLDASAATHMPDVLEMPYRPPITGSGEKDEYGHTYRLGGPSCLAGDVMGDYSFKTPLRPGDKLVFEDMAHYTMVKNNTFNGIDLPDIAVYRPSKDKVEVIKAFGYEDYRGRLS